MTTTAPALPRWDMTVVYPSLESPEFEADFARAIADIADFAALCDEYGVQQRDETPVDDDTVAAFDTVVGSFSELSERLRTLFVYIYSFVTTDSRDTLAQSRQSELQQHMVRLSQLQTRLTGWIGSMDVEALIARSSLAAEHAYMLRRTKIEATHLMSPPEEVLTSELRLGGGVAWGRLHGTYTSQLTVPFERDGAVEQLPMSVVRNMSNDPNRHVRRRAYEAELATWEGAAVPLAAALNSIKWETLTLDAHRGWGSPLEAALFRTAIDRQTLDAMLEAARAAFPDLRRYLHAKAAALGVPALAWYDVNAPLGSSNRAWDFDAAAAFIQEQFSAYTPALSQFAARTFEECWIDAEPRDGKRDGGFCIGLRDDESRILVNFDPSYDSMSVIAHELGHAYHSAVLSRRPYLLRSSPMTLAETASIFCETIVQQAALQGADRQEQIMILDQALQHACGLVVDISSRFMFENTLFERRRQRELSIPELNELMLQVQRDTYGDGLDDTILHPYMWAVKVHYYSVDRPYYNYPYMFGYLFGLGLYAQYRNDPDAFRAQYDDLLSSTGMADAATLAGQFGFDIRTPDFWNASLDVIRGDVARFVELVGA